MKKLLPFLFAGLIALIGVHILTTQAQSIGPISPFYSKTATSVYPIVNSSTLTLPQLGSGTHCLHSVSGTIMATSGDCGSGGGSSTIVYAGQGILVNASGTNGYIIVNNGVTSTAGNWAGTWQGNNSSSFALSASSTQWTTTSTGIFYNNGNVGIGTTGPGTKLEVNGNIKLSSTGATLQAGDASHQISFGDTTIFTTWDNFRFDKNNGGAATIMTVGTAGSGNVGIGTASPAGKLTVAASDTSAITDILVNPGTKSSGNLLDLQVNGTSKFSVTNTGGVTAPGFTGTFYGSFQSGAGAGYGLISQSNPLTISRNQGDAISSLTINQINAGSTGDILDLQAGGVTKMAFQQNGNVGIGTTAPSSTLSVSGSFATGNQNISTSTTLSATSSLVFWIATSTAGTVTLPTIASVAGGTCISIVDAGGNAGTNFITVAAQGANTISGAATTTIATNKMSLTFCSNNSSWYIN